VAHRDRGLSRSRRAPRARTNEGRCRRWFVNAPVSRSLGPRRLFEPLASMRMTRRWRPLRDRRCRSRLSLAIRHRPTHPPLGHRARSAIGVLTAYCVDHCLGRTEQLRLGDADPHAHQPRRACCRQHDGSTGT
jgi:hypothetical protein